MSKPQHHNLRLGAGQVAKHMNKSKNKTCQNCEDDFTIDPEDFEFYKKIEVPEPTFCPECRLQRRNLFRNERKLYKRKCNFSEKEIFSMYNKDVPLKVYDKEIWISDKWDAMEYAKDYDFEKPFFQQLGELKKEVPHFSRSYTNLTNSDYCMNVGYLKNCYLIFESGISEGCAYGNLINYSKDSYDNYNIDGCELCYEGFMLTRCYKTFFSSHCEDCQEITFCIDCVGCSNCFGCSNLRHKKYHIFNKPYSKEEYYKKLKELDVGSFQIKEELKQKAGEFHLKYPFKFMRGKKNTNVTGEYIYHSKNVLNSYLVKNSKDLKYCQFVEYKPGAKDCYDYTIWGLNARLVYESVSVGDGINNAKFCDECYPNCRNLEYCFQCKSSSDLFGCIGLKKKQYCILNKQYTEEEYKELVPKIKKHMAEMPFKDKTGKIYKYGEFFPAEMSPFGYNETIANEYQLLTKEEAIKQGFTWYKKPESEYKSTTKANDLPDHIKGVDESILDKVIECARENEEKEECRGSGVFKMIPAELDFYKKQNISLPRLCPDCRHFERIKQRNPMILHERKCMCQGEKDETKTYQNQAQKHLDHAKNKPCPNKFQTTYAPDRKEIVYCKGCYQKEVE